VRTFFSVGRWLRGQRRSVGARPPLRKLGITGRAQLRDVLATAAAD
jgi:hypothetical protein